ncbi:MAG: NAD(+) synthase [Thomasclavelia sp.]|nr:NAD(+) synthase [Thomasclavelia sp.]
MKDGYLRVCAGSFETKLADVKHNCNKIKEAIDEASKNNTKLLVLPELCLSGYSIEDLFNQNLLLHETRKALKEIKEYTSGNDMVVVFGLPFDFKNSLYNAAAVVSNGCILGIVPKTHIPTYGEFYEGRRFAKASNINEEIELFDEVVLFGKNVVFSCLDNSNFTFGVELCEDLWLPDAPSNDLVLNGARVICNCSASNELTSKKDYRKTLAMMQSAKGVSAYIYANEGSGESTTDVVFSGHHLIYENGTLLNESKGFDPQMIYGDIDLERLATERRRMSSFSSKQDFDTVYFNQGLVDLDLNRYYDPHPFVPSKDDDRTIRCKEVFDIQTRGLMQRLKATGIKKSVIGISGGLDSTLALLVCVMAYKQLGYDSKDIYAITMPCFGTTSRTKNNALKLMEELGVTYETIDISESVNIQFRDLKQDVNNHDVTFENVQARQRTEVLMNKSNQIGGLVIGTGDLSEVALGWSTYNGDHMSMYAVNVSVPKTLVRYLVSYISSLYKGMVIEETLLDVLDTPVSPELLPQKDDKIVQKTEDIVGPYELHDFFLYHFIRYGDEPKKLYRKTKLAFKDKYDKETIKKWMYLFYKRFFSQQFKRSCIPDGPKAGSVALSPRGDWRMPSDASSKMWLDKVNEI